MFRTQTPVSPKCEVENRARWVLMEHQSGKLRTRSQVAPDWTVQDSLFLVNEISAVEGDCLNTLSSFQKWKIIVQNCNVLEVHRTLNQCKRKWDSLLCDYKKIKKLPAHVGFPENFDGDLFKAIDDYVQAQEGRSDTDPDSDPDDDEADLLLNVIAESGMILDYE